MASSFTLKLLHLQQQQQQTQLQLSSSTLNAFQFYLPYHSVSPTKHTLILQANLRATAYSETTQQLPPNEVNTAPTPSADFPSYFNDTSRRAAPKSVERSRIGGEEPVERRVILKDRHAKAGLNSKTRKQVKSKDFVRNTKKTTPFKVVVNENVEEKCGNNGKEKRMKKPKVDPLRVGLDMCSKWGDVMAAIKLYGLAKKEGVNIGQYHYAVLLYLCSSAATGMVQPAKSGSNSRSLSSVEMTSFDSSVGEEILCNSFNGAMDIRVQTLDGLVESMKKMAEDSNSRNGGSKGYEIQVSKDMKLVALEKGFEIYNEMRLEKVPMNEATFTSVARMAMALGDGDMAFDIVKQMKDYGVNPRLRSYGPALAIFCSNGDVENAFKVEKHMIENGVYPEEPELEALLRVSIEAGKSDKVYYVLHKLRTGVRQVLPSTADLIEKWFRSKVASRVGKRKWDQELIIQAMENGGGGWHGKGWLGKGKWSISRTTVGSDGVCKCCGEKLVTIDLDPVETENFAKSVASIAAQREKNLSFQKFQKWLEYYGPFEAVVDAANVGLYSQRKFKPSKVNAVVNGIRQMLPSRKWPLIVLHNRRITGEKMDEPFNRALIEKWKNADALYATPTGSNDDWYWLYAAIKCKSLIVTNDEMRDHLFQLLGNDFFPKWKERHQVHFSFTETGPTFRMPPPCSVVIQGYFCSLNGPLTQHSLSFLGATYNDLNFLMHESEKGHWHVPIVSGHENEDERIWLCCSRGNSSSSNQDSSDIRKEAHLSYHKKRETRNQVRPILARQGMHDHSQELEELSSDSETHTLPFELENHASILRQLEAADKHGSCLIDFQI